MERNATSANGCSGWTLNDPFWQIILATWAAWEILAQEEYAQDVEASA